VYFPVVNDDDPQGKEGTTLRAICGIRLNPLVDSLPTLPPVRSRSTWSARSEARTYDVDGRRVTAILGYEVGPEPIHNQGLQDRQLGPELTRKWGQNSPAKPIMSPSVDPVSHGLQVPL
jgi:hypothetical protein